MSQPTLMCGKCLTTTILPLGYIPNCGDVLQCAWCGAGYVAHPCQSNHHSQSAAQGMLLEILVSGMSKACPQCGVLYRIGEFVERIDPNAGRAIKQFAIGAGIAALLIYALNSTTKQR